MASAGPLPSAAADPVAAARTYQEPTAPATYVEGALTAGYNNDYFLGGGAVELGRRVSSFASLHATLMSGLAGQLFESGSGSITQARVGADLITCNTPDRLCAYAGADVGVQHTHYAGDGCSVFEEPCYPSDHVDMHETSAVEVARAGIDAGGKHVRWRFGLEASFVGGHLKKRNGPGFPRPLVTYSKLVTRSRGRDPRGHPPTSLPSSASPRSASRW